jgi:cell division topological specificity factor
MNLFNFFRRGGSAPVARERLQILLAHERKACAGQSDLLNLLREEILAVVARHVRLEPEKVQVKLDRGDPVSTLEVDIEIPSQIDLALRPAAA